MDQTCLFEASLTRDMNSFKHFSGPKYKTLGMSKDNKKFFNQILIQVILIHLYSPAGALQQFQYSKGERFDVTTNGSSMFVEGFRCSMRPYWIVFKSVRRRDIDLR